MRAGVFGTDCCEHYQNVVPTAQILERPTATVIAGARRPKDAQLLQKLHDMLPGCVHLLQLDVTSQQSVQVLVQAQHAYVPAGAFTFNAVAVTGSSEQST